jgi:hypothetical protein
MSVPAPEVAAPKACPPTCKANHFCKVCDKQIPHPGKFCKECKSYQDWRAPLSGIQAPLALLAALISVITSAVTLVSWTAYHNSHTSAVVVSDTTSGILLYVWNTGRNPSAIVECTLTYAGAKTETFPVEVEKETALIPREGHSFVKIAVPKPTKRPVTSATVFLRVQESNGQRDLPVLRLSNDFIILLGSY